MICGGRLVISGPLSRKAFQMKSFTFRSADFPGKGCQGRGSGNGSQRGVLEVRSQCNAFRGGVISCLSCLFASQGGGGVHCICMTLRAFSHIQISLIGGVISSEGFFRHISK